MMLEHFSSVIFSNHPLHQTDHFSSSSLSQNLLKRELGKPSSTQPQPIPLPQPHLNPSQALDGEPKQKKLKIKFRALPRHSPPPLSPQPTPSNQTPILSIPSPRPSTPLQLTRSPSPSRLSPPKPPASSPRTTRLSPSPTKPLVPSKPSNPRTKPPGSTSAPPIPKRELTLKAWIKTRLRALEDVCEPGTGRRLIDEFQTLPDRLVWKQYYTVISNPLAFENIRVSHPSSDFSLQTGLANCEPIFKPG